MLGDRPIDTNTENDYRWRLARHLLPFFGEYRLDEIDASSASPSRRTSSARRPSCARRSPPAPSCATPNGRRQRPLGPASITQADRLPRRDPRRGDRGRAHRPQPGARPADAGQGAQAGPDVPRDGRARRAHRRRRRAGRTHGDRHATPDAHDATAAAAVAARWRRGMRPSDIAAELGLSKATVSYHLRRLGADGPTTYVGRRAIVATLGGSGVARQRALRPAHPRAPAARRDRRALPDPRRQDARPASARSRSAPTWSTSSSRTSTDLRRAGRSTEPDAYLFPNLARRPDEPSAGRRDRRRGGRARVRAARRRAVFRRCRTRRRTRLRRTYISIALLANRFDVLWVMSQVGHADSKMTMDVYAQLQQRVDREHGRAFDALVRRARSRLYGADGGSNRASLGGGLGGEPEHEPFRASSEASSRGKKKALLAGPFGVARPGLEPGTPRFSVVCSTN